MNHPRLSAALLAVLATAACSIPGRPTETGSGNQVDLAKIAAACADQDVVFFGEVHSNDACHEQQRQFLRALRQTHDDVVVSMEMFERDVQGDLDSYLAGKLPEAEFRKRARAWKNWQHYRPIVQIAVEGGLPVLAANAPMTLVRKVSRKDGGGLAALAGEPDVARDIRTPEDEYYRAFVAVMKEHMGASGGPAMQRMYEAQCVRDETMAETITDYLAAAHAAGRRPLVLHLCGNFHSEGRRGTVSRVLRRDPNLRVKVISTTELERPATFFGAGDDFQLFVTKAPAKAAPAKAAEEEPDPNARPGLGFVPVYEGGDVEGCGVQRVVEGGAAAKAGLRAGDVVVELAGEEVASVRDYSDTLSGLKVGQKVKVVVLRDGKRVAIEAVLGESHR